MPRPLLAPNPRDDTTADVPWAAGYTGPRTTTRTTYLPRGTSGVTMSGGLRPVVNGRELTDDDIAQIKQYFGALADEDARRFGVTTGLQGRELDIRERQAKADRQARLREIQMRLDEDRRQFDASFGLQRDQFGADILKTGASMRGPADYFQGNAFARGVQGAGLAPYLASLQSGRPVSGGATATQGNPVPLTVQTLTNELTGQPNGGAATGATSAPASGTDQYGRPVLTGNAATNLAAINQVAQRGLANLPLGALEGLTDDEQKSFVSGLDYLGRNSGEELQLYKRSRVGQRSGALA